MRIAISSQNLKSITTHAGKCRRFWVYDIDSGSCLGRQLVEIPIEQTFHASQGGMAAALSGVDVLITGSMGRGLRQRLKTNGVTAVVTGEKNPDIAVTAYLNGNLETMLPDDQDCHDHSHDEGDDTGCHDHPGMGRGRHHHGH